jgi:hypothetical protein
MDKTLLLVGGGLGLLWLLTKQSSPQQVMAQQAALANAAALQSQSIDASRNVQNIQTGANLLTNLAYDFTQ